jgi:hypothetical protein
MSDNEATRGHRPCPFDGLDALTYFAAPLGDGWIRCTICGTAGPIAESETEAWRRWDERKVVTANVDQSREAFEREYNCLVQTMAGPRPPILTLSRRFSTPSRRP